MIAVIANDFRETFEDNDVFQEIIAAGGATGSLTDTVIAAMFPLLAAFLSGYVVSALSKVQDGGVFGPNRIFTRRPLSAECVWLGGHVLFIVGGVFAALGLMGLAGGLGYTVVASGSGTSFWDILLAALFSVPATLLFMAVILLAFSLAGKFVKPFAWAFYGYCALITSFAGIFDWPQWVSNFSPFTHNPSLPYRKCQCRTAYPANV